MLVFGIIYGHVAYNILVAIVDGCTKHLAKALGRAKIFLTLKELFAIYNNF